MSADDKSKENKLFAIGDSVILKTGEGPLMKIISFEIDDKTQTINYNRAICNWIKKRKEYTATFDIDDLMHDGPFFISTAIDSVE